jgi:hypothetical protein
MRALFLIAVLVIAAVHAASARLAFEQLMLLVKESPSGRQLAL